LLRADGILNNRIFSVEFDGHRMTSWILKITSAAPSTPNVGGAGMNGEAGGKASQGLLEEDRLPEAAGR
jgi:hypothetical protein